MKKAATLLIGLLVATLLASCGGFNIPADFVAVQEGRGAESRKIKGCKDPSTRELTGNDEYILFPISEREWDATGQKGSDSKPFKSVTNDNVEMEVPVTVRFTLITECDTLKKFYANYARRYKAHFEDDGTYTDGWVTLLRKLVADPVDATLDRIIQGYNWRNVWNDPGTKVKIETELQEALTSENSLIERTAQGKYFEGITVLVKKPEPVNEELAQAVASEQTNVAKAQSAQEQAKADRLKALAEVAVAKAEAAKRRAEIAGYGSKEVYICLKLAEAGLNCKQPQYIVGGTKQ